MAKKGLGRGLDALFSNPVTTSTSANTSNISSIPTTVLPLENPAEERLRVREIPIAEIDPNRDQPRHQFNKEGLEELAQSIRSNGILTPILVVEVNGRYQIVAGERRFRAARLADLQTVPCIVRGLSDEQILQAALIENIQREDLNPLEEAEALQNLINRYHYSQENLAEILGKSRSSIANSLRLNKLSPLVKKAILANEISFGHAKILAGIESFEKQERFCRACVSGDLSVRALEALIKTNSKSGQRSMVRQRELDAELKAFEYTIKQKLGIKTSLQGNQNKGKIILSYSNKDELNTLFHIIENINN